MLKKEIAEFSTGVKEVLREIAARHRQLRKLRPTKELAEYVGKINNEVSDVIMPGLREPEKIFDTYLITAWIQDGMVSIDYKLPLTYRGKFKLAAVITTPDQENKTWDLWAPIPFQILFVGRRRRSSGNPASNL